MPKITRTRIDWMPGPAAEEALSIARGQFPDLPHQALIDRLVLTGLAALLAQPWQPPALHGRDRDRWKLPDCLCGPHKARR